VIRVVVLLLEFLSMICSITQKFSNLASSSLDFPEDISAIRTRSVLWLEVLAFAVASGEGQKSLMQRVREFVEF
jgi:hypothetical protein